MVWTRCMGALLKMCILCRDKHPPEVLEIPYMPNSQILNKAKQGPMMGESVIILMVLSRKRVFWHPCHHQYQAVWYTSASPRLYYNWGWKKSTYPQKFVLLCQWGNIKLTNQVDSISPTHPIGENEPMNKKANQQMRTKKKVDYVAAESVVLSGSAFGP